MALRVKCKCGKSLKISSKFADKKISCPGCKRPFRIPAAKFKAAAAKAKAKRKAASEPSAPAAAPVPAPADLDLQPANLDLELSGDIGYSQSDILGDIETEPMTVAALPHACPSCNAPLAADAVLCVSCGYNLRTGGNVEGLPAGVPAPPQGSAKTIKVAYATDPTRVKQASRIDVVEGPKRGFWADAFASFAYPFWNTGNIAGFVIIIIVALLRIPLSYAGGCLGMICNFIIFGWLAAVYLSVTQETASGSEDMPGIKMEDGFVEDIFMPAYKYIAAHAVAFAPVICFVIAWSWGWLPPTFTNVVSLMLWFFVGLFLLPVMLMIFAFNAGAMVIRLDLIFLTVIRTFLPYLGLWAMLILVGILDIMPVLLVLANELGIALQSPGIVETLHATLVGRAISEVVNVYTCIISMRLIGLYYLHFKQRFALRME